MSIRKAVLAALLGLVGGQAALAAPVPAVTYTVSDGWGQRTTTPITSPVCSSCFSQLLGGQFSQAAESFTLGAAAAGTVTGLDFAIADWVGKSWTPTISIWSSDLKTELFSQTFAAGSYSLNDTTHPVEIMSMNLTGGPTLSAGKYYLSWYDPHNMGIYAWKDDEKSLGSTLSLKQDDFSHFTTDYKSAAFRIATTAPVPEPETYAMMLAGLGMMGFIARRRKVARG
jgi:hypothetical protein